MQAPSSLEQSSPRRNPTSARLQRSPHQLRLKQSRLQCLLPRMLSTPATSLSLPTQRRSESITLPMTITMSKSITLPMTITMSETITTMSELPPQSPPTQQQTKSELLLLSHQTLLPIRSELLPLSHQTLLPTRSELLPL